MSFCTEQLLPHSPSRPVAACLLTALLAFTSPAHAQSPATPPAAEADITETDPAEARRLETQL
ncbi:MAG: hypothetical protein RLZZ458_2948, partial [Planctomycetota bacterium]